MRRLPPLIQLKSFEAAARHLSFKKAAEELHVSPTAVSHQIKLLEDYCQCRLFRRRPRPLVLTRAGEGLYPAIRKGLDDFASALESIRGHQDPAKLVLTTTSSFANKWLTPHLSYWQKAYPSISLEVIATDSLVDLHTDADFSIRYMKTAKGTSEFVTRELFRDEFIVVCAPELLPDGKKFASLHGLLENTLIHTRWSPEDRTAPTWERWCEQVATARDKTVDLNNTRHVMFHEEDQAIEAAINGVGVLIVSDILVGRELHNEALVKALDTTLPGYGFYLTYRKDHPYRSVFQSFEVWVRNLSDGTLIDC